MEFFKRSQSFEGITAIFAITMLFATLIGSLSFFRQHHRVLENCRAILKKPHTFPGQHILNGLILLFILGLCGWLTFNASGGNATTAFIIMFSLALFFRNRDGSFPSAARTCRS
ncbi:MAG: hypothetical protein WDM76_02540 [Limisphaerales bacterium]